MVQQALPTATVSNSWTIAGSTPAATAHESVDDPVATPDDGVTLLEETTQGETFRVNVGSLTDPVSSTGHVIRTRCQGTGSGAPERIQLKLFQGGTEKAASGNLPITRGSWNDKSYTLTAGEADSISDYTDLRIDVNGIVLGGGSDKLEVTQVYLEVPDVSAGLAVLVSPINVSAMI